jgi:hypothetical protein
LRTIADPTAEEIIAGGGAATAQEVAAAHRARSPLIVGICTGPKP